MVDKNTKLEYFPNLDGFRTIAFLIVFLGHCFLLFDFGERNMFIKILFRVFGKPGAGVHFFFVLSGFLISYLLLNEIEKKGKVNIRTFYMRRVLRIWPVYYTVILIASVLSLLNKSFFSLTNLSVWQTTTFLTNFNLIHGLSSLPITILWSVSVEEQFYLVLPLLISLFSRRVFYFFPLFIVSAVIFGVIHDSNIQLVEFHTLSVCGSLFLGCIAAYLVLFHNFVRIIAKIKKSFIIVMYVCFFALHFGREIFFSPDQSNIWLYLIYSFFFAFFILEQNYCENSFFKMSNFKRLTSWGKYTYGLYAYHMISISLLMCLRPFINPAGNYFIYFIYWLAAFAVTFLLARASYMFMEKPFLRFKKRFSSK